MAKIVIAGHTSFCNRGNEALIRSTIDLLERNLPGSQYTVFSLTPQRDACSMELTKVRFLPLRFDPRIFYRRGQAWYSLNRKLDFDLRKLLLVDEETHRALRDCDLLVVSGGDLLSGYGMTALKRHTFLAWTAAGMGKPVVVFAHSINPYYRPVERQFARDFFEKVSLITVRERISQTYLEQLEIKTPVQLSADPAFWLPAASHERVNALLSEEMLRRAERFTTASHETNSFAGISASAGMAWYLGGEDHSQAIFERYTSALANLADCLIEDHHLHVLFIPHVIGPNQLGGDDRRAAQAVIAKMRHPESAIAIQGEYNAMEYKGLIGRCQLFVGSRMHTTVAATSQCVPTIGLAYSIKAHGVLGELVQSRPIVYNVKELQPGMLESAAADLLANHDLIAEEMKTNLELVRNRALISAELAARLVS